MLLLIGWLLLRLVCRDGQCSRGRRCGANGAGTSLVAAAVVAADDDDDVAVVAAMFALLEARREPSPLQLSPAKKPGKHASRRVDGSISIAL